MSSTWVIRDEEGFDWEITPIIRLVKRKKKLVIQQKYVQLKRVMTKDSQNERPYRWMDIPTIDEDLRLVKEDDLQ
jgi:hypothetical protein